MLFNSYPFLLIYLPIVLAGFWAFNKLHLIKLTRAWLLVSSLAFYGYWDIRFLPLLIGSILFNYGIGMNLLSARSQQTRKLLLALGVCADMALLFYFKYSNFFIHHVLGYSSSWVDLVLPLGISFFTFTQIAYLVDTYCGHADVCDLISYGLFVTIFPHLIAGPVLHHKDMIKQFQQLRMYVFSWPNLARGAFLFVMGLFKKVILADNLARIARPAFDLVFDPLPFVQAWVGASSYTLQLYFDFSGYSDMAVGLALLFNMHLPINFNSPYQANSMIDFWRRWHITLSTFLRDYLYIPLGGNRSGKWSKLRNLFITMLLGGIWHGAGWTFILWGVCHGCFLVINHLWRDLKIDMPNWLARIFTMLAVICAWVVFRSADMDQALNILKGMAGLNGFVLPEDYAQTFAFLQPYGVLFSHIPNARFNPLDFPILLVLGIAVVVLPNSNYWTEKFRQYPVLTALGCAGLFILSFINLDEMAEFLYYQF